MYRTKSGLGRDFWSLLKASGMHFSAKNGAIGLLAPIFRVFYTVSAFGRFWLKIGAKIREGSSFHYFSP